MQPFGPIYEYYIITGTFFLEKRHAQTPGAPRGL